jgi:short-subunit dehydrogenase
LESIGFELANKNIRVTNILPGFIETEIMNNISQYPFSISAEKAAKEMVTDIKKQKKISVVPAYPWRLISHLMRVIPDSFYAKFG